MALLSHLEETTKFINKMNITINFYYRSQTTCSATANLSAEIWEPLTSREVVIMVWDPTTTTGSSAAFLVPSTGETSVTTLLLRYHGLTLLHYLCWLKRIYTSTSCTFSIQPEITRATIASQTTNASTVAHKHHLSQPFVPSHSLHPLTVCFLSLNISSSIKLIARVFYFIR